MSAQPHDRGVDRPHDRTMVRRAPEMGIFLLASLVGIYGLGKGLAGVYARGQEISLLWLAVTAIAFFVLFAQMGRVHDTWPHRPDSRAEAQPSAVTEAAADPSAESESK